MQKLCAFYQLVSTIAVVAQGLELEQFDLQVQGLEQAQQLVVRQLVLLGPVQPLVPQVLVQRLVQAQQPELHPMTCWSLVLLLAHRLNTSTRLKRRAPQQPV